MELQGKTIIITGAARIGQHIAESLQKQGANLVITYFKDPKEAGIFGFQVQADVSKQEDIIRNKLRPNSWWRNKNQELEKPISYTLKKGTILEIDRIYIRKGAADYSSITFRIKGGKTSPRFFAKLEDVNKIVF